jgi:hypothetical protein
VNIVGSSVTSDVGNGGILLRVPDVPISLAKVDATSSSS